MEVVKPSCPRCGSITLLGAFINIRELFKCFACGNVFRKTAAVPMVVSEERST